MKMKSRLPLLLLFAALLTPHCGRQFTAVKPEGFAAYPDGRAFRAVSHDRIVYRVRTLKNEPCAAFAFWKEALPKRMADAGYRIIADSTITISNKKALLLEMAAPVGQSDYSYVVAMAVNGKKILIAEAFQKKKSAILKAIAAIVMK